ncbi:MAG: ankyrin repeat domain-containing protein [Kangiellaceae bacterium]|nr:ankyrin repeat domain-containing protein [Kangiellaceae bacterium]MCW9017465.1 ankyrin repeat domain-containing protein [Kangiellaceae bacterium]
MINLRALAIYSVVVFVAALSGSFCYVNAIQARSQSPEVTSIQKLFKAVSNGDLDDIKRLGESGLDVNRKLNGQSAIHIAAIYNQVDSAELLLSFGADPNSVDETNNTTPIFYPIRAKQLEMIKILLKNGASDKSQDTIFSPLKVAVSDSYLPAVKLLLEYKFSPNIFFDDPNITPLIASILDSNKELFDLLIAYKADVNLQNKEGVSALHTAISKNEEYMVKVLLRESASINLETKDGKSIKEAFQYFGMLSLEALDGYRMNLETNYIDEGNASFEKGDFDNAFKAYTKASELGYAFADFRLAGMHEAGQAKNSNSDKQLFFLRRAAEKGHALSQFQLGEYYLKGHLVNRDLNLAINWYSTAAKSGSARSADKLAYIYRTSEYDLLDYEKSVHWTVYAAKLGYLRAQTELCLNYKTDSGFLKKDLSQGAYWCERAANQGDSFSQYNIGFAYLLGKGVKPDAEKAKYWLELSEKNGEKFDKSDKEFIKLALCKLSTTYCE